MHSHAKRSFIIVDASKFCAPAFHTFLPLKDVKTIITDDSLAQAEVKRYRELGIEMLITP